MGVGVDPCPTQPHSRHCSYPSSPRETPEPGRNMLILSWWELWSSRILPLGPAPATARGSGRRRSPGFCSGRDKEEETAAFRRSQLTFRALQFFQIRSPDVLFLLFLVFVLFIPHWGPAPSHHTPFIASGSEMLSSREGKHSQRAIPGGLGTSEKKRN